MGHWWLVCVDLLNALLLEMSKCHRVPLNFAQNYSVLTGLTCFYCSCMHTLDCWDMCFCQCFHEWKWTWWNEHVCNAWWPADWGVIEGELKLQVKWSANWHHLSQTQCWEKRNHSNLINSMKQNGYNKQKIDPTWFRCCIAEVKWWKDEGVLTTTSLLTSMFAHHRPHKWVLMHSIW